MALKLVVTKLVCVKLVIINLWRPAPSDKTDCKKRPVYAMGRVHLVAKDNFDQSFRLHYRRNWNCHFTLVSIGSPSICSISLLLIECSGTIFVHTRYY